MTEPITVDVPAKPAFSRSGPLPAGVAPLVEALTGVPAVPKVEPPRPTAPKVEAPKPPEASTAATVATAAVTVAATAAGVPPVAAPVAGLLGRFTRKQLTIGAAVCSLFVGVGAVRLLFPAKDAAPTKETASNEKALTQPAVSAPTTPPAAKAPAVQEEPHADQGTKFPPLPTMPSTPVGNPPSSVKPTGITPVVPPAPPSVIPDARPTGGASRPEPDFTVPPFPGGVTPAAGAFPSMPPAPPAGSGPPAIPAPPTGTAPPLPAPPAPPSGVAPPVVTPDPKPPIPKPADLAPVPMPPPGSAPKPAVPPALPQPEMPGFPGVTLVPVTPKPPEGLVPAPPGMSGTGAPVLPALPGGTGMPPIPAPVEVTPKLPAIPDTKPMGGVAPPVLPAPPLGGMGTGTSGVGPPNLFPEVAPRPDTGTKPPAPAFDPPGTPFPGTTGFTKPAGATEVKPTFPERAPKTSYDVDVYDPKLGDTYQSISQEWYNSKQYATALRAYNQNQELQGGRYVNVPPLYILQKQSPTMNGGTSGARPSATPTVDAPNWSATPTTRPAATTGRNTFIVPRGGMTIQQVARQTMGSEQRWRDIYDLNPQVTKADEVLPAGSELKMPADARLP